MPTKAKSLYAQAGVEPQNGALSGLLKSVRQTLAFGSNPALVNSGFFCNVIDMGNGMGIALCTDGVGSKMLVAEWMGKYDTIGIDCVAMNVNDIICVGARPISMVDYIPCSHLDENIFTELGKGLLEGARQADIHITGGEIAHIKHMFLGIDIIGSCIGSVPIEKINTGKNIKPGNLIIGLASSGVHANGLTLARKALLGEDLEKQKGNINKYEEALGCTLGAELLKPTRIYVKPIMEMLDSGIDLKAMIQITSSGFGNLNRVVNDNIRFVIDTLPPVPPVFSLIQGRGEISDAEMYQVFNMGTGFCVIVESAGEVETVTEICKKHDLPCQVIGQVEPGHGKKVDIPEFGLELKEQKGKV